MSSISLRQPLKTRWDSFNPLPLFTDTLVKPSIQRILRFHRNNHHHHESDHHKSRNGSTKTELLYWVSKSRYRPSAHNRSMYRNTTPECEKLGVKRMYSSLQNTYYRNIRKSVTVPYGQSPITYTFTKFLTLRSMSNRSEGRVYLPQMSVPWRKGRNHLSLLNLVVGLQSHFRLSNCTSIYSGRSVMCFGSWSPGRLDYVLLQTSSP